VSGFFLVNTGGGEGIFCIVCMLLSGNRFIFLEAATAKTVILKVKFSILICSEVSANMQGCSLGEQS